MPNILLNLFLAERTYTMPTTITIPGNLILTTATHGKLVVAKFPGKRGGNPAWVLRNPL
jgi:hypothetical protein